MPHKPNTSVAALLVLNFLVPAIAAKPIARRIKNHIVKMSTEAARLLKTGDEPEGSRTARLVGTILPGSVGFMSFKLSLSRTISEATVTIIETMAVPHQLQPTTERIFLKVVFACINIKPNAKIPAGIRIANMQ
jgi:hypothetical protein